MKIRDFKRYLRCLYIFLIIGMISFIHCQDKESPDIKPDVDTFFKVYFTFLEWSQADSLHRQDGHTLMDSALKFYNMMPAQFDTTMSYLEKNPQLMLEYLQQYDDSLKIVN